MFCKDLGLADYNGLDICMLCRADRSLHPYNHMGLVAAWRLHIHTQQQFRNRFITAEAHPALHLTGMHKNSIALDTLHINDHNGVSNHAMGSFFSAAIKNRELGNHNKEDGVDRLNAKLQAWYAENGVSNRIGGGLSWSNICFGNDSDLQKNAVIIYSGVLV